MRPAIDGRRTKIFPPTKMKIPTDKQSLCREFVKELYIGYTYTQMAYEHMDATKQERFEYLRRMRQPYEITAEAFDFDTAYDAIMANKSEVEPINDAMEALKRAYFTLLNLRTLLEAVVDIFEKDHGIRLHETLEEVRNWVGICSAIYHNLFFEAGGKFIKVDNDEQTELPTNEDQNLN